MAKIDKDKKLKVVKTETNKSRAVKMLKKYYVTKKSFITVKDNNLLVMNSKGSDLAPTAIKVSNGFYIELGRDISNFETVLNETRVPIMLERINKVNELEVYRIVRVETGNVDDVILGSLVTRKGLIESIIRCSDFKKINNFERYTQLGSLWKLSVPKTENIDECKAKAMITVKTICRGTVFNHRFNVDYKVNEIIVKVKGPELNQEYHFNLNETTRRYELLQIKLISE